MQLKSIVALVSGLLAGAAAIKNPIIPGWNPDPSIIRVGEYFYIATSTFEMFPGVPIYRSTDLSNWELISYGLDSSKNLQLFGIPTKAGVWAPSLSYINGRFYLTSMTRWVFDDVASVWPRIYFTSSTDLKNWTDLTWCDPWGIDPHLFNDPISNKTYLSVMSPNNDRERIWGIYQCEVSLETGKCVGKFRSLWNGTLENTSSARPEGPKMTYKDGFYYLMLAEGGTGSGHRVTIGRSSSPEGPWDPAPNNPLLYNGQFSNLTVQSTGHATMVEAADGKWYAAFLARRNVNKASPLGRESFLTEVTWEDGWPTFNGGKPILLSEGVGGSAVNNSALQHFKDTFGGSELDLGWFQLRTPYTQNYALENGLVLNPNIYSLSDRDVPAALLRKQRSLNMTFSATLLPLDQPLGYLQTVGISAYMAETHHQDIGIRGCKSGNGVCVYVEHWISKNATYVETPLNGTETQNLSLHIRATPLKYQLGYSIGESAEPTYISEISAAKHASASVFTGASLAIFGSGNGQPWPFDAPTVGFSGVAETYFEENLPDYDTLRG